MVKELKDLELGIELQYGRDGVACEEKWTKFSGGQRPSEISK